MIDISETQEIIRINRTDLNGDRRLTEAIKAINGIGDSISKAIIEQIGLEPDKKAGDMTEDEIKELEEFLDKIKEEEIDLPNWLLNRRKDRETGKDLHMTGSDLNMRQEFDIRRHKKIDSYVGWRHENGLPVRGQKTQSSFRSGEKVGVSRKRVKAEAAEEAEEGEEEEEEEE